MIRNKILILIVCGLTFLSGCSSRHSQSIESFNITSFSAEPIYGMDILGLSKQRVDVISEELAPNSAIGVLQGTFGNAIPPLETLINTGKVVAFRAHLGNGPCKRNKNCQPGEPRPYDLKTMKARAERFEALTLRHPNVECYLSPFLEHDEKDKELVKAWVGLLQKVAPSCRVVISAFTGWKPPGVLNEEHGNLKSGDIVSNDGVSLFDSNSPLYRKHGKLLVLGWIHRFNGRLSSEKSFTPPKQRRWQATRDNLKQVTRLLRPEELKPDSPCIEVIKPNLWKSNAEDYGENPDGRGDRPLFISKIKTSRFVINRSDGSTVGCARYYGPYSGGGYRYYVGSCSGDSGVTLMNKARSEWVILRGGGRCFLSNTIRRKGYYRNER